MAISPAQRVAQSIRSHIDESDLSQEAIGAALHISQSALSRRCLGRVEWRASELASLAALLGTTVEELVGEKETARR